MRFSTTRLFPLALMLSLALLTFYLDHIVGDDETTPAKRRHDPDYIVTDFTTTTYDRDGRPLSLLSAARMLHYPDDDSTQLTAPHMLQTRPAEPRMSVTADRGAVSADGEEIFLYDNVVLVREADGERPEARLTTSFLHVLRERSLVRTDREVTIVEDTRSLSGRGMEYDAESRVFTLMADVVGRFEPKK
ncbi:MAG TPA: LPS export ABC transporter periplasmic protein LptC [Burkholderiales bacterium]|jgi:lipopolysaccharide export system protein LptC|nr:LPS export ABC transporter periplasmic protein LptC [Burkholderiales bacterium]